MSKPDRLKQQKGFCVQVVWFKRDLRVQGNRALAAALACGDVLPLYVVEPEFWQQPDMSARQWAFVRETLEELRADLVVLGQPLVVRIGAVCATCWRTCKARGG